MARYVIIAVLVGLILAVYGVQVLASRRAAKRSGVERIGRARDARGKLVKLIDPMPLYVLGRHGVIEDAALAGIAEELEPGVRRKKSAMVLSLIAGVVVLGGLGVMIAVEGRPAWTDLVSTITNPVIMVAVIGGAVAPWITARHGRLQKVRDVMLRHHCCPHCGYGLEGVPAGDDGATTCPECACAWHVDRAAEQRPPDSARPKRPTVFWMLLVAGLCAFFIGGLLVYLMRG